VRWVRRRSLRSTKAATSDYHSFRKTAATLIDNKGLSARIGADHLGHSKVSTTQDRYMSRWRVHSEVAALLDRAINDE
jgi:integrase